MYRCPCSLPRAVSSNELKGHVQGGFDDCCEGQACPSCNSSVTQPTMECLKECPPMDELDHACAMHDSCIVNHPQPADLHCTSFVNCPCDCALVKVQANGSLKSTTASQSQAGAVFIQLTMQFFSLCRAEAERR